MQASVATVTLKGITPMTHSRQHGEPKLQGEGNDDYDIRTWRSKLNTRLYDGIARIVLPAHGVHLMLTDAARYSKRQIPGQGKATWTAKFEAGLMLMDDPVIDNVKPADVQSITISAHVDGKRGSGSRVPRRFPVIPPGWTSTFDVYILDPIITQTVFREMLELAGMFIGMGQFRPQNGGTNGRFQVVTLSWADNRELLAA